MTSRLIQRALLLAPGLVLVFLLGATSAFADCPNQVAFTTDDPLQMLVLGDSIMWGQGLREEEKFSSRVKCWLQEKIKREVNVHVEAHSGAIISGSAAAQPGFISGNGEVNSTWPTINQQLDHAINFYQESRTSPSLILLDGCINDVGVKNLLAASTTLEDLRAQARARCGDDMQALLQRVRNGFPHAQVIVTGYYPIVSAQTADNAFLRLLVKKLNNQKPEAPRMTDKEMRQRLIAISDEWYKTSTASLYEAVVKTNSAGGPGLFPKVSFVEIQFGPEHVFAAPDSLLWNFMFAATNLSGLTKVIVLLSFGTTAYKPNDHMRESRVKSCEATFKKPKGIKEDKKQKAAREDLFLICRYASLGHPNQMGALVYTEAIKGQLLQLIDKAGWKRDTNNAQTLP
ncbi:MAG TPA: SGNH/GDSL hydrolase family protein [Pyrinomonadaceae bacterium]|jgi:lysophospholipase L1-like esterase|nr:SGNH/GDSL hydrolase family protein [Pyrinomonadaceae bacterium]